MEDQSHISLFIRPRPTPRWPPSTSLKKVVRALTAFPEARFMWSLTSSWGGFGGLVAKDWHQRHRSTEQMYGEVFGAVSQVPGLRVFPRLDPPLPTPGQYDVELVVLQSDAPEQLMETVGQVVGAGWQSGKFLYVDTDLKIDLPEARVVIDRETVADLGLDLAPWAASWARCWAAATSTASTSTTGSTRSSPDRRGGRATVGPLLDLKIKTRTAAWCRCPPSPASRRAPRPRPHPLRAAERGARLRRPARRHQGGGAARPGAGGPAASRPARDLEYAGESRQIRREGSALTMPSASP